MTKHKAGVAEGGGDSAAWRSRKGKAALHAAIQIAGARSEWLWVNYDCVHSFAFRFLGCCGSPFAGGNERGVRKRVDGNPEFFDPTYFRWHRLQSATVRPRSRMEGLGDRSFRRGRWRFESGKSKYCALHVAVKIFVCTLRRLFVCRRHSGLPDRSGQSKLVSCRETDFSQFHARSGVILDEWELFVNLFCIF
jgi:hypothetical protein